MRKALLVIPLALVLVAALYWSQHRAGPFYVSGIIEADQIRLGSRVGGRVQSVQVTEGQRVSPGDVLVRLEPFNLYEQLAQANSTLAARQAELNKLRAGHRAEDIAQAQARRDRFKAVLERRLAGSRPLELEILKDKLNEARAVLARARQEHDRLQRLHSQNQAAPEEIDDAVRALTTAESRFSAAEHELALAVEGTRKEDIEEAKATLAEAEAALASLENGFRPEEIAEAEATVKASEAAVSAIQRQIDELQIVAPCDCVVEAVDLQPGDLVSAGAPVLTLVEASDLWVGAYIPENRLDLATGQSVTLRVDALPDRWFKGHVVFVSRQAEFTPTNVQTPEERVKQVFRVKIVIDEGLDVLRAGMSVDVFLERPS